MFYQLFLILFCIWGPKAFDPDEDICQKTSLSGSVNSADGHTYIFKGKYYWQTQPLDVGTGIVGYAHLIKNKWPEIDEPIIASFTLQTQTITVFVCKNKWIAYDSKGKVSNGLTDKWPQFPKLALNTMFSINLLKNDIFAIYDNSQHFHIYDFSDLFQPKIKVSGITVTNERFLWFIDNPKEKGIGSTLKDVLEVKTSISYKKTLILMSDKNYCHIKLTAKEYEKKCQSELISDLLKCPLNLAERPSPKPNQTVRPSSDSNSDLSTSTDRTKSAIKQSSQSSLDGSSIDSNGSSAEELASEGNNKSFIIVAVIFGVIVMIIMAAIVGIIILIYAKKSKTNRNANKGSMASRKSIESIQTVNSNTGAPLKSNSIVSLKDAVKRN